MPIDVGSAVGYLDLDISGFLKSLKTAQTEADKSSKNIANKIGNSISGAGKSLTSAGKTLTKNVTTPIVGIGAAAIKTTADFESSMSKVSAISGATGGDLDKLNKKAQEMGAKTKFSAKESADAFTYMAMAGWKTEDMLNGIDGIMSLAAADGLDLATTSDIVTDALTAFGLSAEDSGHFADVLAKASSNANTNVSLLGESFKYVAPVAGALGYSAEDTAIALGLMANAGIKGSQGGTALRKALTSLIKPTDDAAALMDKYHITMTNSDGSMKSLSEVMVMLRSRLGGLSEAQQAQVASTLFGQTAMSGMLSIINASDKDFKNLTASIYSADGAAEQMANTMLDNLNGQLTLLKSALEGLAIQVGEILMPHLKNFVAKIQELIAKLQSLTPEQKEQVIRWAAIVASIGPVLTISGKLITGIGNIISVFGKIPGAISAAKTAFTTVQTAIAGISAPVASAVAAIGVLIAAFVSLWKNNEEFRNNIVAIWNEVKATFENFANGIVERLNALGFDFDNITEVLKSIWKGFCDFLAPVFEGAFQLVSDVLKLALDLLTGIFDTFAGLFTGNWEMMWNGIKEIFSGIWDAIKNILSTAFNLLKNVTNVFLGWFGTSWSQIWNSIKDFFTGIWNSISNFFTNIWNSLKSFITTTFNSIKTIFVNIWNSISSFLSEVWETMKNVVQVGIMFIKELFNAAFQILTIPFRFIWENCKDTIIEIWDAIKSKIDTVINSIKDVITTVWTAVYNFFTSIWNSISSFVSSIWESIKTKAESVFNSIRSVIESIFNAIHSFLSSIWNAIKSTINSVITAINNIITNVFNSIKNTTTNIWNGIKNAISTPLNAVKNLTNSVVDSIKNKFSSGFNAVRDTVNSVFTSIKNKINDTMNSAKNFVHNAIEAIKGKFKFTWSLPHLKLPHPKVTGKFSVNPPSVPSFSIKWYKKAMNNAMILNGATIFGSLGNKLLGGGEAGSEVVSGLDTLLNMIKAALELVLSSFSKDIISYVKEFIDMFQSSRNDLINILREFVDVGKDFITSVDNLSYMSDKNKKDDDDDDRNKPKPKGSGDGDTFIFYSPKAIDEIEAARQMKQTKRDLAEGF